MDHERIFKATFLLMITGTAIFLSVKGILVHRRLTATCVSVIIDPSTVHWRLQAFLIDQDDWELENMTPLLVLGILLLVFTISLALLVVRCRNKTQHAAVTTAGKFRNPLKNLNLVILVIISSYLSFKLLCHRYTLLPSFLFSHFNIGLIPTSMLLAFLLGNSAARSFAAKRIRSLLTPPTSFATNKLSTILPLRQDNTINASTTEEEANKPTNMDPINFDIENLEIQRANDRNDNDGSKVRRKVNHELVLEEIEMEDVSS